MYGTHAYLDYSWHMENDIAVLTEGIMCSPVRYDEENLKQTFENVKANWRAYASPEAHAKAVRKFKTGLDLMLSRRKPQAKEPDVGNT